MSTTKSSASAASSSSSSSSSSSWGPSSPSTIRSYNAFTEMYYGVSALIAVLAVVRVLDLLVTYYRRSQIIARAKAKPALEKPDLEGARRSSGHGSLARVSLAVLTAFRIVAFRYSIPIGTDAVMLVSEATAIIGYMLGMFLWTFTQSSGLTPIFFIDRAANVGASQIAFVIALAGKNNFVSFFTGISHEKLQVLHRASGRTLLILLWVHGIGRVHEGLTTYAAIEMQYIQYGIASLVALSLAALLSIRPLRTAGYEFFLIWHILLILVFLVCAIKHRFVSDYYFYPGLVIWAFDRLIRVGHMLTRNTYWWRSKDKLTTGTVELAGPDTVRLIMRRPMKWRPGQHAYVVLPSVSRFPFEAHPFTISSICGGLNGSDVSADQELIFLIKCRTGFTRRLRDHATKNGHGMVSAFVDGPYGNPVDLRTYSTCIMVAGGVGITYILPLLLDTVRNARLERSITTKVLFIWVIRDAESLKTISSSLSNALTSAPAHLKIETRIYITRAQTALPELSYSEEDVSTPDSPGKSTEDKEKKSSVTLLSLLKTEIGRPDVNALLQAEIAAASGRVSVDVAGPGTLAKAVRSSLRGGEAGPLAVLKGTPTVSLHVETFGLVGA